MSYTLSDQIPSTIEFLDDSYFNLTKKGDNDFEIQFPRTLPTYYSYQIGTDSGKLNWNIYLPTDKKRNQLNSNITALKKSKLVQRLTFPL